MNILEQFTQSDLFVTVLAFLSANAGLVLFSVVKLLFSKAEMLKINKQNADNLNNVLEEIRKEKEEIKALVSKSVDENIKEQNKVLDAKSVKASEVTKEINVEDLLK